MIWSFFKERIPVYPADGIDTSEISAARKLFIKVHQLLFDDGPLCVTDCQPRTGAHIAYVSDMVIQSFKFEEQCSRGIGLFS